MATKPTVETRSAGSQRDNRFMDTFHDQHRHGKFPMGRPWCGWRELPANQRQEPGFTGTDLQPGEFFEGNPRASHESAWTAPIMPEVRFFDFNYQKKTIKIRYDKMLGQDIAAYDRYYEAGARVAYQGKSPAPVYGTRPDYDIIAAIGEPPRSPKIAEALIAGEPWLLGFSEDVNEELAALLGMNRRGYLIQKAKERPPLMTPEAALAASPSQLMELIAKASADAVALALAARDEADAQKRRDRTKPGRDAAAAKRGQKAAA